MQSVGKDAIGYVMSTSNSNFKSNGQKLNKTKYACEEPKHESIKKLGVGGSKLVRENAASDSVKNTIGSAQGRVTYAGIVLRGKKKRQ